MKYLLGIGILFLFSGCAANCNCDCRKLRNEPNLKYAQGHEHVGSSWPGTWCNKFHREYNYDGSDGWGY